ncbi:hypothetical protein ACJX0J_015184, partial [Zea mays]
ICLWCWHRIIDESGGRCPGCRSVYNKDKILETSARNQILKELCADKSNYQKEQVKSHKQTSAKVQLGQSEPKDPNSIRVIQRKLVYIVGMPTEFASEKLLRQKSFLGQYGKIENIIIDNVGANQQVPDSGRVYVTFAKEVEAIRCIQAVDGYSLDGRPLKATFGVTRYCHIWLSNKDCYKPNCSYVHYKAPAEEICTKDDVSVVCARLQHSMGMSTKCLQHRSGRTLPPPCDCSSRNTTASGISKDFVCIYLPIVVLTGIPFMPRFASMMTDYYPMRLHNNQQNFEMTTSGAWHKGAALQFLETIHVKSHAGFLEQVSAAALLIRMHRCLMMMEIYMATATGGYKGWVFGLTFGKQFLLSDSLDAAVHYFAMGTTGLSKFKEKKHKRPHHVRTGENGQELLLKYYHKMAKHTIPSIIWFSFSRNNTFICCIVEGYMFRLYESLTIVPVMNLYV